MYYIIHIYIWVHYGMATCGYIHVCYGYGYVSSLAAILSVFSQDNQFQPYLIRIAQSVLLLLVFLGLSSMSLPAVEILNERMDGLMKWMDEIK